MKVNVIVTKEREFSWDISVWDTNNGSLIKRAWAMNRDQAIGKADLLADFYRDDNGQRTTIIINKN